MKQEDTSSPSTVILLYAFSRGYEYVVEERSFAPNLKSCRNSGRIHQDPRILRAGIGGLMATKSNGQEGLGL